MKRTFNLPSLLVNVYNNKVKLPIILLLTGQIRLDQLRFLNYATQLGITCTISSYERQPILSDFWALYRNSPSNGGLSNGWNIYAEQVGWRRRLTARLSRDVSIVCV